MARKTRRSKPVKDLAARGRKAAGVKGGAETLTTSIAKDEFLASLRGGTTTPSSTTTTSTTSSRSIPDSFSS